MVYNLNIDVTEKDKNTRFKKRIDIFLGISLILQFVIIPIWGHYDPGFTNHGIPGKMPIELKIAFINLLPAMLAGPWLIYKYGGIVAKKYPFTRNKKFRQMLIFSIVPVVIIIRIFWR